MITDENLANSQSSSNKEFKDLIVGDRVLANAKILNVLKKDEKHEVPRWFLISIFDGTATIRLFLNDMTGLNVGDTLKIEFTVREGKPYNGRPQLAFNVHSIRKSDEIDIPDVKVEPEPSSDVKSILRRKEIQDLNDNQRIKFYTRIITLKPKDGTREKNQKILVADLENKAISVWIPKTELRILEAIPEMEYFILKATVKKMKKYNGTAILSFNSIIRGEEARKDEVARIFLEERIDYYSKELLNCLNIVKTNFNTENESASKLNMVLKDFRKEIHGTA